MDFRRASLAGLFAVALILALGASSAAAVDKALCEQGRRVLPNDPNVQAFKKCATPGAISTDCCAKLVGFGKYYDCLNDPAYKAEVNTFLGGVTTVDKAKKACGVSK
ncbi:hypothetical protein Vretifemale_5586 [Volvox reticuliferus]|uniref:Bifunctional inhibitor/plant lipid transfer protein/seed storage helical domain-containing protein n=1 Tax=Volvox reticuliferus TaxID=1737510 RepID=A0A8J4FHY0_9CHLO|nr:hypothetical protein Vretifemale_5586 [Volvox reticuliferus]